MHQTPDEPGRVPMTAEDIIRLIEDERETAQWDEDAWTEEFLSADLDLESPDEFR